MALLARPIRYIVSGLPTPNSAAAGRRPLTPRTTTQVRLLKQPLDKQTGALLVLPPQEQATSDTPDTPETVETLDTLEAVSRLDPNVSETPDTASDLDSNVSDTLDTVEAPGQTPSTPPNRP